MVTRLQPGDVLILITDGLVEGIDRDIDVAFDEIAKALTEVALSAEAALDELFDLNEAQTIDDAAALLITWKGRQRGPASSDSGGGDPAP
jgi:serine/threonine protein phosphatase PrpC